MSVSDPISDMLTRIRNAVLVGHSTVAKLENEGGDSQDLERGRLYCRF